MTNAEHLIENAITDMEAGENFELFSSKKYNKEMAEMSGINLSHVWEMAQHIIWSLKPAWLHEKEAEMEVRYGYRLDQRNYL